MDSLSLPDLGEFSDEYELDGLAHFDGSTSELDLADLLSTGQASFGAEPSFGADAGAGTWQLLTAAMGFVAATSLLGAKMTTIAAVTAAGAGATGLIALLVYLKQR